MVLFVVSNTHKFQIIQSCLNAVQNPSVARSAVIVHALARMFGVGVWNPAYFYLFPADQYGFVYGVTTIVMIPPTLSIIPMYSYIKRYKLLYIICIQVYFSHDMDFATINYAIAAFCFVIYLLPLSLVLKAYQKKKDAGRVDYTKKIQLE